MKSIRLALLWLIAAGATSAAPSPVTLAHTERHDLASAGTGKKYELLVSLPEDYATSGKRYPVLYVLDGWHFPLLAFLQNNNIYSERMPPVIIVNIGHEPGQNPMPLRAHDFTPTSVQHPAIDRSGGAAAFLAFLEQEIIPLVDRTYRTDPADRGLLGHSLGGLFALYTLIERPGLFQRIVSASPAADWDHSVLLGRARTALKGFPRPVRLDLSAGDEPDVIGHNITGSTAAFAALLDELKPANLEHRYTYFPGENHNSIRPASFPAGLYWVYRQAGPATDATATITAMLQEFLAKNSERAQHDRFWADDLVYTGSGAAVRTKAEIMKNFDEDKNAAGKPRNPAATYSAEDILVRPYGSAAALTFRLVAHNPDGTVQYYRNSGTLLLRNDRWQVVTWQATLVPAAASKP